MATTFTSKESSPHFDFPLPSPAQLTHGLILVLILAAFMGVFLSTKPPKTLHQKNKSKPESFSSAEILAGAGAATLVIVDMQEHFPASKAPGVLQYVEETVLNAIEHDFSIIFLEYESFGDTHKELTMHIKNHPASARGVKLKQDGSDEVKSLCEKYGFNTQNFVVVGVYTDQCVAATVEGLSSHFPDSRITVLKKGCNSNNCDPWQNFPSSPQIKVLENSNQFA